MDPVQNHLDQLHVQLHEANARLAEREQQLTQAQQNNAHFHQLQLELNNMRAQLQHHEQQVEQLQLATPDLELEAVQRELAALRQQIISQGTPESQIDMNNEFTRGRVPDLIKGLPQFNGNSKQITQWIQSVERILHLYQHLENSDFFPLWLQEIRNKITGEAGDLLASNGTPLNWGEIKKQLTILYGDKRELSTLLQKLFSLKQTKNTVNEFHTEIQDCFTGISTQIQMSSEWTNPGELVKFVDKICLEKFVDGLEEPYSSHVGLLQPKTLGQAFQFAMEKANKVARKNGDCEIACRSSSKPNTHAPLPLPPKPRNFLNPHQYQRPQFQYPMYNPSFQQPRPFNQQLQQRPFQQQQLQQSAPKIFNASSFHNGPQILPRNTFAPRTMQQSKPIPMEVDNSVRSNKLNYMNRPRPVQQPYLNYNFDDPTCYPCNEDYNYNTYDDQNLYDSSTQPCIENQTEEINIPQEEPNGEDNGDNLNFHMAQEFRKLM